MYQGILQAMGGLGLFLLGMVVMTDGLKGLAGDMIRQTLTRFTHSPTSGALTGAATTAVLQSSSATTVAAIGFVSASLLTFPQALGIIFGANIGTTITGWLVAILGFKFQLASVVSPLILVGVLMRLFGHGKIASSGMALAGFSLIFIAITLLQGVMEGVEGRITPDDFPADTVIGRLKLVAIGASITLITQSSSAGVAAALAAVHVGTISFPQAMAMVIGMDISTAIKAIIASIGGSIETRRTGLSNVVYNLYSGIVAFMLLTPYTWILESISPDIIQNNAEIALVGFHTSFNIICVIAILPFTNQFANLIQHLMPGGAVTFTGKLDRSLLKMPGIALETVKKTLQEEIIALMEYVQRLVSNETAGDISFINLMQSELDITHNYVDQIHLTPSDGIRWKMLLSSIHTLDHMQRLHERCEEDTDRVEAALENIHLRVYCDRLANDLDKTILFFNKGKWKDAARKAKHSSDYFSKDALRLREKIMQDVATGKMNVPDGTDSLEGVRWLRRVSLHICRILHHYSRLASTK
ncbi:MAG: Na/Pi cotransporter family protein [Gammaproteobacteria bacterium]|nr:MAG: Na/Pi cotransporter family protein [Gammaproteobacteria bacterium]